MNRLKFILVLAVLGVSQMLMAQDDKTLFDYPQVPDTISTLENRSNYYVAKFWDNLDMTKPIKDEDGFKKAFVDYITFFPYAKLQVVEGSLNSLLYKAQANSGNFKLLAQAAEQALYSPEPVLKSDATYYVILGKVLDSGCLSKEEKVKYQTQMDILVNNKIGAEALPFKYKDLKGKNKKFGKSHAEYKVIYFDNPDCDECVIGRLRLSVDMELNKLIDEGKVDFYSISLCEYSKVWAEQAKGYSDRWMIGASDELYDLYDLRLTPNLYIINKDGVIVAKNVAKLSGIFDVVNK